MSTTKYDVIVVGAGIVGAACADACAQRGMRVAVLDRGVAGGGATAAAMGHVVVMDGSEAQFALTRYSQLLWHSLGPELPDDVEYSQRGTIWVAADEQEMAEVRRKEGFYRVRGVPVEILDPAALEDAEPNLRKGFSGGLLVPEDVVVNPPCAARFLIDRARLKGAKMYFGVSASRMGQGEVITNEDTLYAPVVVNAAGVGASTVTSGIEIKKRKGHLVITDRHPGFVRHQLVELGYLKSAHSLTTDSVAFNVQPRANGQILIGSSRQYGAENPEIDRHIMDRMLQRAQEYMLGLAGMAKVREWTGFRAATPDNLPLIGPLPEDPTVFLATGHEGLGITTSLATAQLLVHHLLGTRAPVDPAPYLPSRTAGLAEADVAGHAEKAGVDS